MKRSLSRGYSILAALVFVALLGTALIGIEALAPSVDRIAMSAATEASSVSDNPPSGNAQCGRSTVRVNYACYQEGEVGKIDSIQQKCNPGFKYTVVESKGNIKITPTAMTPPNPSCKMPPTPRCSTGSRQAIASFSQAKCEVRYCVGEAKDSTCATVNSSEGQPLLSKEERSKGIQNIGKSLAENDPAELEKFVGEVQGSMSPSEQSALDKAFSKQQESMGKKMAVNDDKIKQLQAYVDSCQTTTGASGCNPGQFLASQAELGDLKRENDALKNRMSQLAASQKKLAPPAGRLPDGTGGPIPQPQPRPDSNVNTFPPGTGGGGGGPQGGQGQNSLGSMFSNLLKGITGGGGKGQTCSQDPNTYQQQQQQYQQQYQQYQMQMQQYQYYRQYGTDAEPPVAPSPCTPGSTTNTCPAEQARPTTGCTNGTWVPVKTTLSNGRQCNTNWQCNPSSNPGGSDGPLGEPTAELSCQPKVVDVGMSVAISFSCGNSTGSTGAGEGFTTDNATSGARTVAIKNPPSSAKGINFGLTCRNQSRIARAECSVEIARPHIVLVANPQAVASGESSRVGWITSGMQSCTISSPQMPGFTTQHANNKSVNGSATTSPVSRDTTVVLTCTTVAGGTKAASTTITIGTSTTMTVSSSLEGKDDVKHGSTSTVSWSAPKAPAGSAVALWLIDLASGQATGLIERSLQASSTYTWVIPAKNSQCPADSPFVCGADLVAGRSYTIRASLYTPAHAYLGGFPPQNPVTPTYLDEAVTKSFKIAN